MNVDNAGKEDGDDRQAERWTTQRATHHESPLALRTTLPEHITLYGAARKGLPSEAAGLLRLCGPRVHREAISEGHLQIHYSPEHVTYVSVGLVELGLREVVLRTRRVLGTQGWATRLMRELIQHLFKQRVMLKPGGQIAIPSGCAGPRFQAALLTEERELTEVCAVPYTLLVLATKEECRAARRWNVASVLELIAQDEPALVADLARGCLLEVPAIRRLCREGSERDGSSCRLHAGQLLRYSRGNLAGSEGLATLEVRLDRESAEMIREALCSRLRFNRSFEIVVGSNVLRIRPGLHASWRLAGVELEISIPWDLAERWLDEVPTDARVIDLDRLGMPGLTLHPVLSRMNVS